ncbi:hypothetical protein PVK06_033694 [Gossypium arboreum]|uniref:Uncharacterized protein n=1 Tax=Gossypium arboreum TaxID=29729 RepID=A0ABR0NC67_GOSAR|nr:hypothetical protein PVK06_033694 [Gossypium arboreum]
MRKIKETNKRASGNTRKQEKKLRSLMEEENRKVEESLVVMKYDPDFYEISSNIA